MYVYGIRPMRVPEQIDASVCRLRRHRTDDIDAFVGFATHPTASRYLAFTPEQRTPEGARNMLAHVIAAYDSADPVVSLTIADPVTDRFMGSCGGHPDGDGFEIYYAVLPRHRRHGLATAAARTLVDYVFRHTKVPRVTAYVVAGNVGSVRVVEKLGFVDSGTVRRQGLGNGAVDPRRYVLERWPLP